MTDAVLMNFYIPRRLKTRLEEICDLRHLSRTSFILTTLECGAACKIDPHIGVIGV